MKDRVGNTINEKDTVVILTPETAKQAVQGVVIAVKPVLNAPPNAPPLTQIAVSVVLNFIVPTSQTQLDMMWVVKQAADAKGPLEL